MRSGLVGSDIGSKFLAHMCLRIRILFVVYCRVGLLGRCNWSWMGVVGGRSTSLS